MYLGEHCPAKQIARLGESRRQKYNGNGDAVLSECISQGTVADAARVDAVLYIESDGTWRVIAPTETGPQPFNPGGEMAMWTSKNEGKSWEKIKQLTSNSPRNHSYARRPLNAHPDFYALWADGHGREASESYLYFTDRKGSKVWRLPQNMKKDFARPEIFK